MTAHDEFFTPEEVDEQIELLSRGPVQGPATDAQAAQAISQLHELYTKEPVELSPGLERAWRRIVEEHQSTQQRSQKKGQPISMQHYARDQQEQPARYNDRT